MSRPAAQGLCKVNCMAVERGLGLAKLSIEAGWQGHKSIQSCVESMHLGTTARVCARYSRGRNKMKTTMLATGISILMAVGANAAFAECGDVSITEMDWASGRVTTEVAKFVMEHGYGCNVQKVPSSTATAMTSMAENGEPDVVTEIWLNSAVTYPSLVEEGKVVTLANVIEPGGNEGWWIPSYLAEEHPELTNIEGILANPELVGGMFHNCPVGWGCKTANDNLAVAFDFSGNGVEIFTHGSGDTLSSSLASAYSEQAPWFGFYWGPTAILGKYDMVMVDLGPLDEEAMACNQNEDCMEPKKSSFPVQPVLTGAANSFVEREPEVAAMLEKLSFTNDQMAAVLSWQEENNASTEQAAVHYLTTYKDVWREWLNDEATENLAAILK